MKQALMKASPPTETIELGQSITTSLHAREWGWTLAGSGTLGDGVRETALVDDGNGGTSSVASQECMNEGCNSRTWFGETWRPGVNNTFVTFVTFVVFVVFVVGIYCTFV